MPESEVFKMVMNGGMLGFWAVAFWWALAKGVPLLKELFEKQNATINNLTAAFEKNSHDLSAGHREQVRLLADAHTAAVERLDKGYRETVKHVTDECREERKELRDAFYAYIGLTADKSPSKIIVPAGQTQPG